MRKISLLGFPISLFLVAVLLVAVLPSPMVMAELTPQQCYGTVTLDGVPAPLDTTIEIFVGGDANPSGSGGMYEVGGYGTIIVTAEEDRYGEPLTYKVNGFVATKLGPDDGIFGLKTQIVNLAAVRGPESPIWSFPNEGMFPRHLPDNFSRQVVLTDLDPATIPPEVQGVYSFDDDAGVWKFWGPGAPGTTLDKLVSGLDADYKVIVTGDCEWNIQLQ